MKIRETMLPVLRPKGGKEEVQALQEVIESGWWAIISFLYSNILAGGVSAILYNSIS